MNNDRKNDWLPETRCSCETMPLGIGAALELAGEHIREANARILAEMP